MIQDICINAIINSVKRGNEDAVDITVTDVEKCFDSLWAQDCIKTLFDYGLPNEKIVFLYEETNSAMIAIKTATGMTSRENIHICKDQWSEVKFVPL